MPEEDQELNDLLRKAKAAAPTQEAARYQESPVSPFPFNEIESLIEGRSQFQKEAEQQVGAPVDIESGAPWSKRFFSSFRTDPEQVVKYWQNQYGEDNVKLLKSGDLLVGIPDEKTKKNRYVVVDEPSFTAKDFMDLAGSAPGIAMTIIAMRGGKRLPGQVGKRIGEAEGVKGLVRDVTAAAAGQFTGLFCRNTHFALLHTDSLQLLN